MFVRMELPADGRWYYEDPSGLPEPPLFVQVPESLRPGVETAAAGAGVTPTEWLVARISAGLAQPITKAA
jgi:hypothetical protein